MTAPIRVTVWNEFWHENPIHWDHVQRSWMSHGYSEESAIEETEGVRARFILTASTRAIAAPLRQQGFAVQTAILDDPEQWTDRRRPGPDGCNDLVGTCRPRQWSTMPSPSASIKRIVDEGMGFIALHWGAGSKVFKKLMGTSCSLTPLVGGTPEKLWVIEPGASHRPRFGDVLRGAADRNLRRAL